METDSVAPAVLQAEASLDKQDYAAAEELLLPVVSSDPHDSRAWFDLGYVYKATNRRPQAIEAYRQSVAAKPDLYEANLNLGLLLAQDEHDLDAARYLQSALKLMPGSVSVQQKSRIWMALGRVQQRSNPLDAVAAFRKAAELFPKDTEPHVLAARTLESSNVSGAESEYKAALAIDPKSQDALAGLAQLYRDNDRPAEAATALREYAKQFPGDPQVHLMLGQSLLKSGDTDGALTEFDAGLKQAPNDIGLLHEVAAMYASQKKFQPAASHYSRLVQAVPTNAAYHYEYGVVLMQLHQFHEAQEQLIASLQHDGKLLDAYGELAVAASENKQYPLAIKVLDARSKLALETPATFFLRATAYDSLKAFPQAAENYHKFLDASNGQFPDKEWQARHRLIAIEPEGGKKKK